MAKIKVLLNPKYIEHKIVAAPKGQRIDHWDCNVEGLSVRVTDTGAKTYSLLMRLDGKPVRRTIGPVGKWSLEAARKEARKLQGHILDGNDPKVLKAQALAAKKDGADKALDVILEAYITEKVSKQVNAKDIGAMYRREFIKPWKGRHIDTIKAKDISDLVRAKANDGKAGAARAMLAKVSKFFKWARATGLTENVPAYGVSATELFGPRPRRKVILTEAELAKVWKAALEMAYPVGPVYLLLILTGLRLKAVVNARRSEIDMKTKMWTIPASRMKGKGEMREQFTVPLTPQMIAVIDALPRFNEGDCLFSLNNGVSPLHWGATQNDAMRAAAKTWKWVNHDLRRTMRSSLEAHPIRMSFTHAEAMIAHKQPVLGDIYNQYKYPTEMRDGFHAWNAEVVRITGGLPKRLKLAA